MTLKKLEHYIRTIAYNIGITFVTVSVSGKRKK